MKKFSFERRISFYETDAMGIVHHSNYLRIVEDARVDWFRQIPECKNNLLGEFNYPLVSARLDYISPLRFDDLASIDLSSQLTRAQIIFNYEIYVKGQLKTKAETTHAIWDNSKNTVVRPPAFLVDFMAS